MNESPESVVRRFFAAWTHPDPDELGTFFDSDAVWVDGPQGVRRGVAAITAELVDQLAVSGGVSVDVKALVSNDTTVMVEQTHSFRIAGKPISAVVMAVFELTPDGRIRQWREAYDLTSVTDQITGLHAAGG